MEKGGGQDRIGPARQEGVPKMRQRARASGSDQWHVYRRPDLGEEFDIVTVAGTVAIHASDEQFTRAELRRSLCPINGIQIRLASTAVRVDGPDTVWLAASVDCHNHPLQPEEFG